MRSGWRDFMTTDGEKPDRHRDTEFVIGDEDTREALMERWQDAYHVGQIVQLAMHYAGDDWKTLSIPKGGSEAFNRAPGRYGEEE